MLFTLGFVYHLAGRSMRRINPHKFQIATSGISRGINRQIALNLIRTHQPISRADFARMMGLRRGAVSLIVTELLEEASIFEGMTGAARAALCRCI
jgi:hypothetical protein